MAPFIPKNGPSPAACSGAGGNRRVLVFFMNGAKNEGIPISWGKKFWTLTGLGLLGVALLWGLSTLIPSQEKTQPKDAQVVPSSIQAPPPLPDRIYTGKISKGQNLSSALRAQDLPKNLVETICGHLKPLVNLRKIKPGDIFEVRLNPQGKFLSFTYTASPLDVYHLDVTPSGEWQTVKKDVPVEKYWARVSGEISSSLFEAMDQRGEEDSLTMDFADIFAWEIDFHTDIQPGDRFEMVVEKYYVRDTFVRYGRILYADYRGETRRLQAIFFESLEGLGGYYTPQGDSLRKAFLRSPLKFTRISSGYSKSRRHPILGGNRPHLGVDYAAPQGAPVWAVADGTVISCGWNGGYGKQVIIRHPKGYQSMYGHLSSFAPGIKKGKTVHQKEVIGYVGSTGLSTGPHLDFRLLKNGVPRNPLREISPRAPSLTKDQIVDFQTSINPLLSWVRTPSASPYQKIASLSSRDLDLSARQRRKKR